MDTVKRLDIHQDSCKPCEVGKIESEFLSEPIAKLSKDGAFGVIVLSKLKKEFLPEYVAIKYIKPGCNRQLLKNEREMLEIIAHPNIISYYGYTDTCKNEIGLVLEYMECGNLDKLVLNSSINFTWNDLRLWMIQVLKALGYLKEKKIIHKDVTLKNMLLSKRHSLLKLCDLGHATYENSPSIICGTPSHMAPEIFENNPATWKTDIFSFGICLWQMIFRIEPYEDKLFEEIMFDVITGVRPEFHRQVPIQNIIEKCWSCCLEDRPNHEELIKVFQDSELKNNETTISSVGIAGIDEWIGTYGLAPSFLNDNTASNNLNVEQERIRTNIKDKLNVLAELENKKKDLIEKVRTSRMSSD